MISLVATRPPISSRKRNPGENRSNRPTQRRPGLDGGNRRRTPRLTLLLEGKDPAVPANCPNTTRQTTNIYPETLALRTIQPNVVGVKSVVTVGADGMVPQRHA
eukprot:4686194-Lingulodinium_polyedra.AAC.1